MICCFCADTIDSNFSKVRGMWQRHISHPLTIKHKYRTRPKDIVRDVDHCNVFATMKRTRDGDMRVQPELNQRTQLLRQLHSMVSPLFYACLEHKNEKDLVKLLQDLQVDSQRQTQ